MKKVFIFIGGVVTGAILMIVVSMLIAGGNSTYSGITLFEKEGECIFRCHRKSTNSPLEFRVSA